MMTELNKEQREAVLSDHPRILCLAGAGCGKTKTMVTRAARLIEEGVDPENILMLTFTNAAAQEQKERLIQLVGEPGEKVWASTFHSWAVREIRRYGRCLGYDPTFSIYDQEDRLSIVEAIIDDLQIDVKSKDVIEAMEKNNLYGVPIADRAGKMIVNEYRFRCKQQNAIDLDTLIPTLQKLIEKDTINRIMKTTYKYVFVDEFQDTDRRQLNLLQTLDPENLFVVGDDFQSIYGFRGADVGIIMSLAEDEGWYTIKLEKNYRSTRQIVNAANKLIKHNKQTEKTLRADREGPEINVVEHDTPEDELYSIGRTVAHMWNIGMYRDVAVLARTNKQVDDVAKALNRHHIPYEIRQSVKRVLQTTEAKRLFQWMAVVTNPMDDDAVYASINWPKHVITRSRLLQVEKFQLEHECSLMSALECTHEAEEFRKAVNDVRSAGITTESTASLVYGEIVRILGVMKIYDERGLSNRKQLVKDILAEIKAWEEEREKTGSDINVAAWLEFYKMRLIEGTDTTEPEKQSAVQLMTAHGSKGLEFSTVFIVGCNQGMFPISRGDIEEERRLFYVAMTRAKDRLIMTRGISAESWGGMMVDAEPSVFLEEIK
jgi:DNA helicase-2/ATP-dependent DNA helicase PcrA